MSNEYDNDQVIHPDSQQPSGEQGANTSGYFTFLASILTANESAQLQNRTVRSTFTPKGWATRACAPLVNI